MLEEMRGYECPSRKFGGRKVFREKNNFVRSSIRVRDSNMCSASAMFFHILLNHQIIGFR